VSDATAGDGAPEAFDDGRYLYCVVDVETGDPDAFGATGVDDEPVRVVAANGVGAVVHGCETVYDSEDPRQVQRWLLAHQRVVDEAATAFGTPLPFRFDTILRGDDEAVADWLRAQRDELAGHLGDLAGYSEYRVVVTWDEAALAAAVADDDELADLRERVEAAGEGKQFLLEKQLEQRRRERRRAETEALADEVDGKVEPLVRAYERLGDRQSASVAAGSDDEDAEVVTRVALLAHEDRVDAVGDRLDEVAAADGVEVRFTGPWPPYTFAPELGGST